MHAIASSLLVPEQEDATPRVVYSVAERLTEGLYSALAPDRTGTMLS